MTVLLSQLLRYASLLFSEFHLKCLTTAVQVLLMFQKSSLDDVSMWLPYLKELKPLVQILVCEECTDDDGQAVLCDSRAIAWANSFP